MIDGTRQQVLHLYLSDSRLSSKVVAWAFHDPTDGAGPGVDGRDDVPPYERGTDALRESWRLLQASQLVPPSPGAEHAVSYLPFEFVFERLVPEPPGGWPPRGDDGGGQPT